MTCMADGIWRASPNAKNQQLRYTHTPWITTTSAAGFDGFYHMFKRRQL